MSKRVGKNSRVAAKDPALVGSTQRRITGYTKGDNLWISPFSRLDVDEVGFAANPTEIFGLTIPDIPTVALDIVQAGAGALVANHLTRYLVTPETHPRSFQVAQALVGIIGGAAISQFSESEAIQKFGRLTAAGTAAVSGFNLLSDLTSDMLADLRPEKGWLDDLLSSFGDEEAAPTTYTGADGKTYANKEAAIAAGTTGLGKTLTVAEARRRGLIGSSQTAEQARQRIQNLTAAASRGLGKTVPGSTERRVAPNVASAINEVKARLGSRFTPVFMRG